MSATGVLRGVAHWLGGTYHRGERIARGMRDGVPTSVRFTLRGTGYERTSHDRRWTEIDVAIPPGYPLSLHVRRHDWTDQHLIESSAMVDVLIGDPDLDRAFLIEAAPARIARRLLSTPARHLLASYDAAVLTTETFEDRPVLHLAAPTWLPEHRITAAIETLVGISLEVRSAYATIDAAALRGSGSPYRPQLDDAQVDAQRSNLADEVAHIDALRAKR
jgi:hypothetical protein